MEELWKGPRPCFLEEPSEVVLTYRQPPAPEPEPAASPQTVQDPAVEGAPGPNPVAQPVPPGEASPAPSEHQESMDADKHEKSAESDGH